VSCVTTRWSFSPGGIAEAPQEENDDFCWETASTVPIDWDAEESSILAEDEYVEDVAVVEVVNEDKVPSPPRPPPSPEDNALLHQCYREFKEISCSPTPKQQSGKSPVFPPVSVPNSARSSKNWRKKYNQRLTKSDHNRDLIRKSVKNILKA
jgi:hypothetical protein